MSRRLKVGTRGSKLALEQARIVCEMLTDRVSGLELQTVTVRTTGDLLPPARRGESDGKGTFTRDIESLLLSGELDLAVHSMKDLSVDLDPRLVVAAAPPRGDPRDALVSADGKTLLELPRGSSVGTSSARRKAQLLKLRSDLAIVDVHGNVETRVGKMGKAGMEGVVVAAAGLDRLSIGARAAERFPIERVVPAAGQGTLAVEMKRGDRVLEEGIGRIGDEKTMIASECEREFARVVGADCNLPVGAYASFKGRSLTLTGMIASPDGARVLKRTATSTDPLALGRTLGEVMLQLGGAAMLAERGGGV